MASEPAKTSEEIDSELLTAYLDGELSDADCIGVEKRLAEDPGFHRKMCELQNAWDMLDSLPLIQPNSQFVQTTIEMAIAGKDSRKTLLTGKVLRALMLLLIPAALFGVSYFVKRESIEQPERELVYDLPLIENHDRYSKVIFGNNAESGITFLKSVYAKGLFREVDDLFPVDSRSESLNDFEPASLPPNPQKIRDRSDRLSRLTDEERAELFEKKTKFEAINESQKETLREFHDLLADEPERDKLVDVMASYYDWLKILGASQRANLLDLPPEDRLKEIGRITRQQAQDAFGTIGSTKLPPNDAVLFYKWYDFSVDYYEPEIRERTGKVLTEMRKAKGLPTNEMVIDRIKSGPIEELVEFLMRNDRENFGQILCDNTRSWNIGIDYLRAIVSDEAGSIIDQPDFTEQDRQELILKWIEAANRARFPIKSSELKSFYAELTQEQRDKLDNLHPDQWYDSLTRMYWEKKIGQTRSAPSEDEAFQRFLRQSGWETEFGTGEDDS
ncbi:anti-sigma factor family protein [Mariniblastus fucicola]|uniref:Uncharacterized protein n=1 Tax=Mariniblastus fucicola TaxID=980251 RepID=A0A5B9PQH5_9BACT|nr:hypothetical protein [Mariniblastus fucicola]QEG24731.1 hypothetical protein MFFC18_46530 [Mariniblastus fucicola]